MEMDQENNSIVDKSLEKFKTFQTQETQSYIGKIKEFIETKNIKDGESFFLTL